jgi:hypothetical protein
MFLVTSARVSLSDTHQGYTSGQDWHRGNVSAVCFTLEDNCIAHWKVCLRFLWQQRVGTADAELLRASREMDIRTSARNARRRFLFTPDGFVVPGVLNSVSELPTKIHRARCHAGDPILAQSMMLIQVSLLINRNG